MIKRQPACGTLVAEFNSASPYALQRNSLGKFDVASIIPTNCANKRCWFRKLWCNFCRLFPSRLRPFLQRCNLSCRDQPSLTSPLPLLQLDSCCAIVQPYRPQVIDLEGYFVALRIGYGVER
jgi:hypothetical protein